MGDAGKVVTGVLTGGASTIADDVGGSAASSLVSGGLSDVIEGHTPFSRAIENAGENLGLNQHTQDWLKDIAGDILSPIGFAGQTAYRAHDKATEGGGSFKGGVWADRFIDPSGTIDYSVREMGNVHRSVAGDWTDNAQQIGAIVGGMIGNLFPVIGTGIGAAVGSGIGSKTAGGTHNYDYTEDLTDAGISYIAAEVMPNVGSPVGGAVAPYTGQAGGKVVGGAAQGGLRGAAGGVKPAVESGSIDPIWKGAATGAVLGGVSAGGQEIYGQFRTPTPEELAYQYAQDNPGQMVQVGSPQQAMTDEAYRFAEMNPGTWVNSTTGQINPTYGVGTPETMFDVFKNSPVYADANPSGMYPLDGYGNIQYAPAAPEIAYPLGSNAERLNAINAEPQFASDYIHPYTLGSGHGADVPIGSTNYDPNNTYNAESSSLVGSIGEGILNNLGAIKNLAGLFLNNGQGSTGVGEDTIKGKKSPEQGWLTYLAKSGTGVGKSKGLDAGEVEKLKYDPEFYMPGKRIKGYKDTELYK